MGGGGVGGGGVQKWSHKCGILGDASWQNKFTYIYISCMIVRTVNICVHVYIHIHIHIEKPVKFKH